MVSPWWQGLGNNQKAAAVEAPEWSRERVGCGGSGRESSAQGRSLLSPSFPSGDSDSGPAPHVTRQEQQLQGR